MTIARVLCHLSICAAAVATACLGFDQKTPVFDKGEMSGQGEYKERPQKEQKKEKSKLTEKAIAKLIKDLKDPDADTRKSACEILMYLQPPIAVEPLIDVLRPQRNEPINVAIAAHGALVKITGQNFGYKDYDKWISWWTKNRVDFLKKAETGVDPNQKLAAEASNTLGLKYMGDGEFAAAQGVFLDAVNKDPSVPDYKNNLGNSLREQGLYLDAMEYYQETIGINKDLPQPYMNIGICFSRMGKGIEAQSWFKKAIERDKNGALWELPWMIGKECMRRGEWTLAYEYLDQARNKAEKRNIHDAKLHVDLAITHYGMDQYHSAWKELTNVRTLGYEPNEGFVAKVRKALVAQGVDPDEEDRQARQVLRAPVDDDQASSLK